MPVPVVDVRVVRMAVGHRLVDMEMRVRLRSDARLVRVLVMLVVDVPVRVFETLVQVLVLVSLRQVQRGTNCHQQSRRHQASPHGLVQHDEGDHGAEERRQ